MARCTYLLFLFLLGTTFMGHAQVVINEICASNLSLIADNYGKHEDWIELHNPGSVEVNLSGWYLSDDPDEVNKWWFSGGAIVPPGGYLLVWCSGRNEIQDGHYHSNFKISQTKKTAEQIVLSNPSAQTVDIKKVKTVKRHYSYGRKTDAGSDWGICTQPTPGTTNNTAPWYEDIAKKPEVDVEAGFYTGSVMVSLSTTEPNAKIRYTLTGNEPTTNSTLYNGSPIPITSTKVLKAVVFPEDTTVLPSLTEFNTYFINISHSLPVLSVAGNQLLQLANGNQNLRPFGTLEYFGKDKQRGASITGELNSHGQDSWVNSQRSLDWVSRDEMGENSAIKEALFPVELTDRDEFQRIILRAAGDDNYPGGSGWPGGGQPPRAAHMRDAYTHNLAKLGGMHLDVRNATKAIIYLNGQYWGVYDLRELPDDHDFTEYNYNQGKYDLQYLLTWGGTWAEYWDTYPENPIQEWNLLVDFIKTNNMADPVNFDAVQQELDYKSLADYMIANSFSNASDWLNYNTGWWRGMNPEGGHQKWGYILWDLDATYAYYINYTGILDTSATAPPCSVEEINLNGWGDPQPQNHLDILKKLRDNPVFNQYWIARQADMIHTVFSCENMLSYFDTVRASIEPEMNRHIQKWGGTYSQWYQNTEQLRHFIGRRCEYLSDGLKECYNLTGPYPVVLKAEPAWGGTIEANTLTYSQFPAAAQLYGGIDLQLKANPVNGFSFLRWETKQHSLSDSLSASTAFELMAPDTIIAHFDPGSVSVNEQELAQDLSLSAYPTIVQKQFQVAYSFPQPAYLDLFLTDQYGKMVQSLVSPDRLLTSGAHLYQVDASQLTAGTYYVTARVGAQALKSVRILVVR